MHRRNRMKQTLLKQARARLTGYHNQCPMCGELFDSIEAFDMHRVGPMHARLCLDKNGMRAAGLIRSSTGLWHIAPAPDADRAALELEQAEA